MMELELQLRILTDDKISKDVKIDLILDMLHLEAIDLKKARELCMVSGIYTKHWEEVGEETIRDLNDFFKREGEKHEQKSD